MSLNCLGQKKKKKKSYYQGNWSLLCLDCVCRSCNQKCNSVFIYCLSDPKVVPWGEESRQKNVSNEDLSVGQAPLALAGMPVHVPLQCPCCSRLPRLILLVLGGKKCNSFAITRQLLSHFWLSVSLKLLLHVKGGRRRAASACTEERDPC